MKQWIKTVVALLVILIATPFYSLGAEVTQTESDKRDIARSIKLIDTCADNLKEFMANYLSDDEKAQYAMLAMKANITGLRKLEYSKAPLNDEDRQMLVKSQINLVKATGEIMPEDMYENLMESVVWITTLGEYLISFEDVFELFGL